MRRVRFALRSLARAPMLSLVVTLSLGLGIGVNTAIFSLLHQVVLSKLPVPRPEQLVLFTSPADLKSGRSWDNDSGDMNYIFNWRTFGNWRSTPKRPSSWAFVRSPAISLSPTRPWPGRPCSCPGGTLACSACSPF